MPVEEDLSAIDDAARRAEIRELLGKLSARAPHEAAKMLSTYPDQFAADMLTLVNPAQAQRVLQRLPSERRQRVMATAPAHTRQQWARNDAYPDNTVGHMMEPPLAVFPPGVTVAKVTEELRRLVGRAFITYVFVADENEVLVGVVAMREMLLARAEQRLEDIMVRNPFTLRPEMELVDAMRATMVRHYPVYPVCEEGGKLIGLVRGQMLFEARTVELSLQPGSMVGVEKEERLATAWTRSFRFRHPWLQANLLLGFLAAAVVGMFQGTIDRLVLLAVFLPVVIGQSSNTGVQTLAVALRSMTLGELRAGKEWPLVVKETLLGVLNGALTGVTAALGMFIFAKVQRARTRSGWPSWCSWR
jgi:magnesium transporter